jgi:hypothetical protein
MTLSVMVTQAKPTHKFYQLSSNENSFIIILFNSVNLHCSRKELINLRDEFNAFTVELERGGKVEKL